MPKSRQVTDTSLLEQIRQLAAQPQGVAVTRSAQQGMVERSLTRAGVCQLICEYLDGGGPVDETITDSADRHEGQPAYQLYPTFDVEDLFVKVGIEQQTGAPTLRLISVHKRH